MILTDFAIKTLIIVFLVAFIIGVLWITERYAKLKAIEEEHGFVEQCWVRYGSEYCKYTDSVGVEYCTREVNHKTFEVECE